MQLYPMVRASRRELGRSPSFAIHTAQEGHHAVRLRHAREGTLKLLIDHCRDARFLLNKASRFLNWLNAAELGAYLVGR